MDDDQPYSLPIFLVVWILMLAACAAFWVAFARMLW